MENLEYFEELKRLSVDLQLQKKVTFLKSPNDGTKLWLLNRCQVLLYTPENEHFGIVPLEGMYMSKPVIAVNSGGPTETIINDSTGFLCNPEQKDFSDAMMKFINNKKLSEKMGKMGKKRVMAHFSFEAFSDKINRIVTELLETNKLKGT